MRALRALLPAPGLSALVLALWLLLARPPSAAQLLLGLALALVVPRLFPLLRMPPVRLRNPRRVLGYMRVVAGDVVASNIEVGIGLFRGGARAPKPSFVVIFRGFSAVGGWRKKSTCSSCSFAMPSPPKLA